MQGHTEGFYPTSSNGEDTQMSSDLGMVVMVTYLPLAPKD